MHVCLESGALDPQVLLLQETLDLMNVLRDESNGGLESLEGYHHVCFDVDSVFVVLLPPNLLSRIEVEDLPVEVWSGELIGLRLRIIHR